MTTEKSKKLAKTVAITLASAAIAAGSVSALAASKQIKCFGIAKKGKNDCGTKAHSCAGQATKDNAPNEWVYMKKSNCIRKGGNVGKAKS